jgi:hypothetical protein
MGRTCKVQRRNGRAPVNCTDVLLLDHARSTNRATKLARRTRPGPRYRNCPVVLGEALEVEGDRCAHFPLYLLERFACRAAPGRSDEQDE